MSFWGGVAGAAIGAGASIASGLLGARATEKAADQSVGLQRDIYRQNRADLAPYREVGASALGKLSDIYLTGETPFQSSPGYDFRMEQGVQALDRSASANGRLNSGRQDKALLRFGQGLAAQDYDQNFNRLASLAGIGQTANTNTAALGANFAGNAGAAIQNAGQARASAYENAGSAINSGIGNLLYLGGRYGGWFQ